MKNNILISVDAGGTSTKFYLFREDGSILNNYKIGSGSPCVNKNALEDIYNELELIENDIDDYNLCGIVIGMSGIALIDVEEYKNRLKKRFNTKVIMENDAYMALYSVLKDDNKNGCVAISGTGAIVLALNEGKMFIGNGSGELLTERGSGYGIVRDYIKKMFYTYEEKGIFTPLQEKFLNFLGYNSLEDFKVLIYKHQKNEIAKISDFFFDEANNGNQEAIDWLYYNGTLLGIDVVNSVRRVNMDKSFVLGFRGGSFDESEFLSKGIIDAVTKAGYKPKIEASNNLPASGGYFIAKINKLI